MYSYRVANFQKVRYSPLSHIYRRIPTSTSYITLLFYIVRMGYLSSVCVCRFCFRRSTRACVREKCQEQWRQISYRRRCARAAGGAWKTRSAECARVEFRRRKSRSHTARRKWLIAAAGYLSRRRVFHGILSIRSRSVADILENNSMILFRRNVNRTV